MTFSGLTFLYLFLPTFLGVYYLVPKRAKNAVLMVASLLFYAWGEPFYIVLLINLSIANFIFGYLICRFQEDKTLKRAFFIISLAVNLAVFASCKFSPDLVGFLNRMIPGRLFSIPQLALPLGLSFYTISCISYIVDLYTGKCKRQKNFIRHMVYITMFPKLLAGPVTLYRDIESQLGDRSTTIDGIADGIGLFIKGLAKKVLLANNLSALTMSVLSAPINELPVVTAWLGIISFVFQFYFDFSGYTDMARGLGKMIGFDLPRNFRTPFMATSVTDFWKRWNISLVSWMREYVYKPLGGSKKGNLYTLLNGLILCLAVAFWHGLGLNFQMAALFYFAVLLLERVLLGRWLKKLPNFVCILYTFFVTILGFVILTHDSYLGMHNYLKAMFGLVGRPFYNTETLYYLTTYLVVLVLCMLCSNNFLKSRVEKMQKFYPKTSAWLTPVCQIVLMVISTAYLINSPNIPFIMFRV